MSDTTDIQSWLAKLSVGDKDAINALVGHTYDRLQAIARKQLRGCPQVRRWEETDDLCQQSLVRLIDSLHREKPAQAREYFGLATFHIRQALVDLIRHYTGPLGLGKNHATEPPPSEKTDENWLDQVGFSKTYDPAKLAEWLEFHEQASRLPDKPREVFHLHWYGGLELKEIAALMNESERNVRRHWRQARLLLHEATQGESPAS